MKTPNMYADTAAFEGITLRVDPINRERSEGSDNAMAMFHEEQPLTWHVSKPFMETAFEQSKGVVDFLDVGTGSGVFGILVSKHFQGKNVVALDKSPRAIEMAKANSKANGVEFELKLGFYNINSIPRASAKVIGLYPPYHLYPDSQAEKIPQHARGGSDGQGEFKSQLVISDYLLADEGIIFFNQMCLGGENGPDFLEYIPKLVEGASVEYTNVFPRISTREFLRGVYGDQCSEYVGKTSEKNPWLYYCVGIVRKDGKGTATEFAHDFDLQGRTWADRILLHKELAQMGLK